MPGRKAGLGIAFLIDALIGQAHAVHQAAFDERFRHRHAGPDLHRAGGHQLAADVLHELAEREDQAAFLVEERRNVGQLDGVSLWPCRTSESAPSPKLQGGGAAAGADRVEQVDHLLLLHGAAMGIWLGSRSGKLARMPRARVTTPETPKPMSSARS